MLYRGKTMKLKTILYLIITLGTFFLFYLIYIWNFSFKGIFLITVMYTLARVEFEYKKLLKTNGKNNGK